LAAAGTLLSLALALGITLSLTRPIRQLIKATERVSEGHLVSNAEVVSKDEIGLLVQRFNDMLDRLKRSFSDQRRFYVDVSHELRTPLTVIRGEAEVALRGPRSVSDHREALERVLSATNQMGCLIDELLFLARSEAGQIRYEMADIALPPLLEEVVRQYEGVAGQKGVRLDVDGGGAAAVRGDRQHLRQVFAILLDNAIKYTKAGGKVSIALEAEADGATVLVSDSGIGMTEEELSHVFERFYRGDTAKEMREEGTGLGLSIAKSIARAHGGQILIDSALGLGTTVSVMLPRNPSRE
jgi:heavy metal sensor kinase